MSDKKNTNKNRSGIAISHTTAIGNEGMHCRVASNLALPRHLSTVINTTAIRMRTTECAEVSHTTAIGNEGM